MRFIEYRYVSPQQVMNTALTDIGLTDVPADWQPDGDRNIHPATHDVARAMEKTLAKQRRVADATSMGCLTAAYTRGATPLARSFSLHSLQPGDDRIPSWYTYTRTSRGDLLGWILIGQTSDRPVGRHRQLPGPVDTLLNVLTDPARLAINLSVVDADAPRQLADVLSNIPTEAPNDWNQTIPQCWTAARAITAEGASLGGVEVARLLIGRPLWIRIPPRRRPPWVRRTHR